MILNGTIFLGCETNALDRPRLTVHATWPTPKVEYDNATDVLRYAGQAFGLLRQLRADGVINAAQQDACELALDKALTSAEGAR